MKKKRKTHEIDNLDLTGKRICVLGLQGSGKSYLAKYLMDRYKRIFIIDPMNEYHNIDRDKKRVRIVIKDEIIPDVVFDTIENTHLDLLIVDEMSRFAPSRRTINPRLRNFADVCRHPPTPTTFLGIARRPGQVFTDYIELAHYIFIFRLRGRNDSIWLANQATDLPTTVHGLKQFEFVCLYPDRTFKVMSPV